MISSRKILCLSALAITLGFGIHPTLSRAECPPGWSSTGETQGDVLGASVAGAGDVDGDGFDDIIVGAPGHDAAGSFSGRVYVYSGQSGGLLYTFDGVTTADWFGFAVSSAGDFNDDGFADFLVGAPRNNTTGIDAGRVYVYSGQTGTLRYVLSGEGDGDYFGLTVSGSGDVNSDGFDDFIVGAGYSDSGGLGAGRAYVYSGKDKSLLYMHTGEAAGDGLGSAVSGVGDVNNDGFADYAIGAMGSDAGAGQGGRAYVYSGQDGTSLAVITGTTSGEHVGGEISGVGDVDNDGFPDFIIGSGDSWGGDNSGWVKMYSGQNNSLLYTLTGFAPGDRFGFSVFGIGDANNDIAPDFVVGALENDVAGSDAGQAYVFSGPTGALLHTFTGEAASDKLGVSVSGGDFNNDGAGDVIVGAYWNDENGASAGKVYVHYLGDSDADGVSDDCDLCPGFDDAVDSDADSVPDGCDVCAGFDDLLDTDGDSVPDGCDNCVAIANPDQVDGDSDGIGESCDLCDSNPVSCCCHAGDSNHSASVTIADATFLISRIFAGGPAPICCEEADSNGSGAITIGDVTYLIAHIFTGGAAPICGPNGMTCLDQ